MSGFDLKHPSTSSKLKFRGAPFEHDSEGAVLAAAVAVWDRGFRPPKRCERRRREFLPGLQRDRQRGDPGRRRPGLVTFDGHHRSGWMCSSGRYCSTGNPLAFGDFCDMSILNDVQARRVWSGVPPDEPAAQDKYSETS